MKKFSAWGSWLFVAVLVVGSVVCFRDFTVPLVLLGQIFGGLIYQNLDTRNQKKWLVPCGIALALVLGGLHYITTLMVFPHSVHSGNRLGLACFFVGLVYAAGGLLTGAWSPNRQKTRLVEVI